MIPGLEIAKEDFLNSAFEDVARDLIWIPRTKILSNTTGAVTYKNQPNVEIKGILTKRTNRYDYSKEGLVELGDAFLQVKEELDIMKDDFILTEDETFRVDEVLLRQLKTERFFKSVVLFKVDSTE